MVAGQLLARQQLKQPCEPLQTSRACPASNDFNGFHQTSDYSERFANTAAPLLGFESRCTAVSSIFTLLALMLLLLLLLLRLLLLLLLLLLLFLLLVLLLHLLFLRVVPTCAHIVVFQILLPSMHAGRGGF